MRIRIGGEKHELAKAGAANITWPIQTSDFKTYRDIRSSRLRVSKISCVIRREGRLGVK